MIADIARVAVKVQGSDCLVVLEAVSARFGVRLVREDAFKSVVRFYRCTGERSFIAATFTAAPAQLRKKLHTLRLVG